MGKIHRISNNKPNGLNNPSALYENGWHLEFRLLEGTKLEVLPEHAEPTTSYDPTCLDPFAGSRISRRELDKTSHPAFNNPAGVWKFCKILTGPEHSGYGPYKGTNIWVQFSDGHVAACDCPSEIAHLLDKTDVETINQRLLKEIKQSLAIGSNKVMTSLEEEKVKDALTKVIELIY